MTKNARAWYEKAKHNKRGEREKRIAIVIGAVALPLAVIILGNLFYVFFQTGLPYLILSTASCVIPYVLSVIGMSFYSPL